MPPILIGDAPVHHYLCCVPVLVHSRGCLTKAGGLVDALGSKYVPGFVRDPESLSYHQPQLPAYESAFGNVVLVGALYRKVT